MCAHTAQVLPADCVSCGSFTCVQNAVEGEAAVLDVKGKGVRLQTACGDHLDGLVVTNGSRRVHIHIGKVGRSFKVHTTGNTREPVMERTLVFSKHTQN